MFQSIPDYRKTVLLLFLIKNDKMLLKDCGFLESGSNFLNKEFKTILMERNEEHFDYIENEEESIIERIPNE